MIPLPVLLGFALASGPFAVLGGAPRPAGSPGADSVEAPRASPLARALLAQGVPVIAEAQLRDALLRGARARVAELQPETEAALLAAQQAYDHGNVAEAADLAAEAATDLGREPPSERRELNRRQNDVLWGAALLATRGRAAAVECFERALTLSPGMLIDVDRFAPPVQQLFERVRAQLAKRPRVSVEVSGTPGATLYVDGTPRGALPLKLAMLPHRATLWIEVLGEPGLAHEVDLPAAGVLWFDWQLEVALHDGGPEAWLWLPSAQTPRRELLARVAALGSATDVLLVERPSAGAFQVTRYDASGRLLVQRLVPIAGLDWAKVARALIDLPTPAPAAAVPPAALSPAPAARPVAALSAAGGSHVPWLWVGVIAGGVVLAGTAIAVGLSVHPSNAVLLGPQPAAP